MFCLYSKLNLLRKFYIRLLSFIGLLSFISLMSFMTPVQAENSQTIDIKANYLLLDENKGISKYKGQVLFTKGTLSIKADTVTLYYHGEKLTKALITGSPADVHHEPDNEDKVHSQAQEMEFFVTEDKLSLKGQAFVDQGSRHFSGEYIEYDTRQRIITAAGNQTSIESAENTKITPPNSRVHVIIGPNVNDEDVEDTENSTENEKTISE